MALEVHLTDRDVGLATAGLFNENKWEEIFRGLMTLAGGQGSIPGFVLTGLDQNAVSGLDFTFNAGDAVIAGFPVKNFPQTLVTLPASQNDVNVYLELTKDGGGDISGAQLTTKTDFTLPANPAILLRYFKTGASSINKNEDRRSTSARIYTTIYEGNGLNGRILNFGFQPRAVWIFPPNKLTIYKDGVNDPILTVSTNSIAFDDVFTVVGGIKLQEATGGLGANGDTVIHHLVAI